MVDLDAMHKDPWPTWPVDKEELRGLVDEVERLLLIEQGAADLCDTCGWRMKFPNEECRNCENAKLREETKRLRTAIAALKDRETVNGGIPRGGAAVSNCCGDMGDGAVSGVSDV